MTRDSSNSTHSKVAGPSANGCGHTGRDFHSSTSPAPPNQAASIESQTIHRIQVLPGQTLNLDSAAVSFLYMKAGPRMFLNHELGPREFRETTALRHQFIESSAFDHVAAVEHQNARGMANGREPVCDHEGRASLHDFVERGVDLGFGDRIERAGRLVEDQDRW